MPAHRHPRGGDAASQMRRLGTKRQVHTQAERCLAIDAALLDAGIASLASNETARSLMPLKGRFPTCRRARERTQSIHPFDRSAIMPTKFRLQLQPEIVVIAVALLAVAGAGIAMFGWQPDSGTIEPISAMNSPLASQGMLELDRIWSIARSGVHSPRRLWRSDRNHEKSAWCVLAAGESHDSTLNAEVRNIANSPAKLQAKRWRLQMK